jgi:multidrug efflux pump subunit AcrA (membrane-fusion protein)
MNKKISIYLTLGLVILALFIYRIHLYNHEANKEINAIHEIQKQRGIPVKVLDAKKQSYDVYQRVSAIQTDSGLVMTYVTGHMKDRFIPGQYVECVCGDTTLKGKVVFVANRPDVNIGLYAIRVQLNKPSSCNEHIMHIRVRTRQYKNVNVLPNESITTRDNKKYVWKIVDSKAVLAPITIEHTDGLYTVIKSGLKNGDLIVYRGTVFLKDGSLVVIVENKNS